MLRWPQARAELLQNSVPGSGLLELYESYELASTAATYWAKATSPQAAALADEYRNLVLELEGEIQLGVAVS